MFSTLNNHLHMLFYFSRPETSFFWLSNPWKSFRFIFWRNYKWYIIGITILILILLLLAVFLYSAPVSDCIYNDGMVVIHP